MKKNGFTLVELLAVIIILGLLALLIVPKVNSIVKESKVKSYEVSINNLVKSLNSIAIDKKTNLISFNGCIIDFDNDNNTCTDLEYSGELPDSGSISVDSGGIVSGRVGYENDMFEIRNSNVKLMTNGTEFVFGFTGSEQEFTILTSGYYKLETWGAQGGNASRLSTWTKIDNLKDIYDGGYGGYSTGSIFLEKGTILYVYVGGIGENGNTFSINLARKGGYNGGGNGFQKNNGVYCAGGGGASHIALKNGLLSELLNDIDDILIVSGGGAGAYSYGSGSWDGNSGGGYIGGYDVITYAGKQSGSSLFGHGGLEQIYEVYNSNLSGGGGGFYGGQARWNGNAGGGSGYIGNQRLKNKVMYCYQCDEANGENDDDIRTIATENVSETPISNYAKIGNGYARITYLGESLD